MYRPPYFSLCSHRGGNFSDRDQVTPQAAREMDMFGTDIVEILRSTNDSPRSNTPALDA